MRIRKLLPSLFLGDYEPGYLNSLVDVPGIKVHTQEIIGGFDGKSVNTGITCILPREDWLRKACYAGVFRFNGSGELTGAHNLAESGLLYSPIVITGTFGVGAAHQGIYQFAVKTEEDDAGADWVFLPVVGETFDGYLNDVTAFAVKPEHVIYGLENVSSQQVREGNTGGGVGMICHNFKGGTGSSSRLVPGFDVNGNARTYTIAALVQANYGKMADLRIGGAPIGRILAKDATDEQHVLDNRKKDGSIIVILATDAPLHPQQLQRVAKRATVGLARVGGKGHNLSGDIFLAFSTGNEVPVNQDAPAGPASLHREILHDSTINPILETAADVVEESIYNALCMAETLVGNGHKVEALPLDRVRDIMARYV